MLIITPKDQSSWTAMESIFESRLLGPALRKNVLEEVLKLQEQVMSLKGSIATETGDITVSLKDICFSPLQPDNNNCTVLSPLSYFQNNIETLNITKLSINSINADYLSHIDICSRSVNMTISSYYAN